MLQAQQKISLLCCKLTGKTALVKLRCGKGLFHERQLWAGNSSRPSMEAGLGRAAAPHDRFEPLASLLCDYAPVPEINR